MIVTELPLSEAPPLEKNEDGVIRLRGTRVSLDTAIAAFNQGYSAEQIVLAYPSVSLADAYTVIGYYLRHRDEVDRYISCRRAEAQAILEENRDLLAGADVRRRLLARRRQMS